MGEPRSWKIESRDHFYGIVCKDGDRYARFDGRGKFCYVIKGEELAQVVPMLKPDIEHICWYPIPADGISHYGVPNAV